MQDSKAQEALSNQMNALIRSGRGETVLAPNDVASDRFNAWFRSGLKRGVLFPDETESDKQPQGSANAGVHGIPFPPSQKEINEEINLEIRERKRR